MIFQECVSRCGNCVSCPHATAHKAYVQTRPTCATTRLALLPSAFKGIWLTFRQQALTEVVCVLLGGQGCRRVIVGALPGEEGKAKKLRLVDLPCRLVPLANCASLVRAFQ